MANYDSENCISDADLIKLQNIINVVDAAKLILGSDSKHLYISEDSDYETDYLRIDWDTGYKFAFDKIEIIIKSLTYAIKSGSLKATVRAYTAPSNIVKANSDDKWITEVPLNSFTTTILRDDLKIWLEDRGVYPPQLFPFQKDKAYLSDQHPHFSPKLAACVNVWQAAQDAVIQGQTVKQWMQEWLSNNKEELGLGDRGAKVIDQLATISNWDTSGGRSSANLPPNKTVNEDASINHDKTDTVHPDLVIDDVDISELPF